MRIISYQIVGTDTDNTNNEYYYALSTKTSK